MKIRNIICGYTFCHLWECPLKDKGCCMKETLTDAQVIRRFIRCMETNKAFHDNVKRVWPNEYVKYYNGVQYD